ncbi:MAG: AAA family ATPase [Blautia sp.]|nr:AAA family ATPase [Blautia sp.]MCM1201853.1 AAA family ATPase [Bacteroides fragilis]
MVYVHSVLWRNFNQATIDTLSGKSAGQYDIRLGAKSGYTDFFEGVPHKNLTSLGGYELKIKLEEVIDSSEQVVCEEKELTVRYMGGKSTRKDWNIPSQRPETAYPMWIQSGRYPGKKDEKSYILLIRSTAGKFYGRILLSDEVNTLPDVLKDAIGKNKDFGIYKVDSVHSSTVSEQIYERLLTYKNLLLYGPPGTGKTTVMQEVVNIFNHGGVGRIKFDENKENDFFSEAELVDASKTIWTTFHQSYSYEEFVIGMMTSNNSDKLLEIEPRQGKLLEAAEFARKDGQRSLLVIDELNRANVSRVFGEFITVMEPDKRLDEEGNVTPNTVSVELPYIRAGEGLEFEMEGEKYSVKNPYYMPYYFYTIASMNSVDKSIFPLDSALRRRFYRYDLYPDRETLSEHLKIKGMKAEDVSGDEDDKYSLDMVKIIARDILEYINEKVSLFLGRDYTLGHSYFWNLSDADDVETAVNLFREDIFERIFPQLEELFRSREEQMMYILRCGSTKTPYILLRASDEEAELGAVDTYIQNSDISPQDLLEWARRICKK